MDYDNDITNINHDIIYINSRINYYIGNLTKKKWNISCDIQKHQYIYNDENNTKIYDDIFPQYYGIYIINDDTNYENFKKIKTHNCRNLSEDIKDIYSIHVLNYDYIGYIKPLEDLYKSNNFKGNKFLVRPGDVFYNIEIPVITKTRPANIDSNNIIINLNYDTHWCGLKDVDNFDISFEKKNDKIIWRGASNGFCYSTTRPTRLCLAKKYSNHSNKMIDIGFSASHLNNIEDKGLYIKESYTIQEQLKSKFLISVEGGDVATNLKWMLYSNSVVLMPKPTMVSWIMEDKLEEWIHYIPLDNEFNDVEEKYNWCLNNLDKCEEIAMNGKKYIQQFFNKERENLITKIILEKYIEYVNINIL